MRYLDLSSAYPYAIDSFLESERQSRIDDYLDGCEPSEDEEEPLPWGSREDWMELEAGRD